MSDASRAGDANDGIVAQFKSFNFVFWLSNLMEMFERLAYYGLRTVLPVFMVLAVEEGGPEFNQIQKGIIFAWWAAVQSGIPIVSGGYADRYGYKKTVGVSIAIKIMGYVVMAYAIEIAGMLTGGASNGHPGHEAVYCVFMVGALLLAGGTAVFKPGIQGILALQLSERTSSLGWSVFYQLVNVGGFLGPILAGVMRLMQWRYVFLACAVIVALNYIILLMFKEPDKQIDETQSTKETVRKTASVGTLLIAAAFWAMSGVVNRLAIAERGVTDNVTLGLLVGALVAVLLPFGALFFFNANRKLIRAANKRGGSTTFPLASVALGGVATFVAIGVGAAGVAPWETALQIGAGIMLLNLFVLLGTEEPDDADKGPISGPQSAFEVLWDSILGICEPRLMGFLVVFSGFWAMFYQLFDLLPNYITDWVDARGVAQALVQPFMDLPDKWHGHLPQEYMINVNAGMCMLFAFIIGYYMGKVRSMVAMIIGMAVASTAIWALGFSLDGWFILLAIASFSLGELMSSPTKMRYFSGLAPKGKKALYLGYINATTGIGWALGSVIAGEMYEKGGDKVNLARRYLIKELDQAEATVTAMKKTEVIPALAEKVGKDVEGVRVMLFEHYDPSFVWDKFALIGVASMIGLIIFDRVTRAKLPFMTESTIILALTAGIASWTYGLTPGLAFGGAIAAYLIYNRAAPDLLPGGQESGS